MFRRGPRGSCWHFCENCPHWPWFDYELDTGPVFRRWCRTCVRMLEADTGEVEWPHDESFAALEDACERGLIVIRHRPDPER